MAPSPFFHWIKELPSHSPRGPPLGSGLKAGIAKCHFAWNTAWKQGFHRHFLGFSSGYRMSPKECSKRKEMPLAQSEKTVQITVKLPQKQYEALKKYAASKHLSMADIVRAFVQKGMSVEAYTEEIDFITDIIRQEISIAINGLSNRLAGLVSKDLIMSAAAYYSTIAIIADLIDTNRYTTFREIERKARQLAVEYTKMKLSDAEKLLLSSEAFEQNLERLRGGDTDVGADL
ncbi:hypothetical protein [Paenibacillus ehimensis]|uniref:hypothetical protein n=1 Tax=Paenibacillus ehimensis TaxID=79264 RepID=UPI00046EDE65|nr:hypothetical protein [Paenibacillus ehimensis]